MLTVKQIEKAKADGRAIRKLRDEKGLYLWVYADGKKYWRFRYYWYGKERSLALGVFPQITLETARARRDAARKLIAEGSDPAQARRDEKLRTADAQANTFERVAREFLEKAEREGRAERTLARTRRLLASAYPAIGGRPVGSIEAPDLLGVLRRYEAQRKFESARRLRAIFGQVFRYAIATGRATHNPTPDLKGALTSHKARHFASITEPEAIGALIRAIDDYTGQPETRLALRLLALTFVRLGELRHATWDEFDVDGAIWNIPAERMKMRRPHRVPLSLQALAVLEELQPLTGRGRSGLLFPSVRSVTRPMSENTLNAALRRLGYTRDEMTSHGFRSMAATRLNEARVMRGGRYSHWPVEAIERQLAHAERNKVRAAYTSALEYWEDRVEMMQWWADYLDTLRAGAKVVPLRPGA